MKPVSRLRDWLLPWVGVRSVLFGAHCWFLHPIFVWRAWWKLYGFPRDPRLYAAFFLHDLGYLVRRCRDMDGPEGERHVEWAAGVMGRLFGPAWSDLCLYHSRFYARKAGKRVSRLGVADKFAVALTPAWLYLPMARASGELAGYLALAQQRAAAGEPVYRSRAAHRTREAQWYADVQCYMAAWVAEHRDGRDDTWTPLMGERLSSSQTGVWR